MEKGEYNHRFEKIFKAIFKQQHSLSKAKVALSQKAQGLFFIRVEDPHMSLKFTRASRIDHYPF